MSVVDRDPPSVPVGVQQPRAPLEDRGGQQLVQWLSVQADHMAGSLQQNARALMVRAASPMPAADRHADEVARLRAQLQHSKIEVNGDMRALLQNQALAIEQFQNRWEMAGQEAHAFVVRTRSESEDFVGAELSAIERFEDRMQHQYSGELQKHVHALQDECHEHVGQEESKLRIELTKALTHESQVCKDHEVLSHQEVAQLRSLVAAQQEELRSVHQDCADLQRKRATTEAELQRKSAHEEHALYQHFDNAIKEKDAQVHALQHELSRLQEKQRVQLEAECFEAERLAASMPVFAEGSPTVRFATPVEKVATVADFHSPDMSLGASAGNMNLKTRTAGQTMVINARRRLGMKTTPQPDAHTAAQVEAKGVSRPSRRMRSKGPLDPFSTKVHVLLQIQEEKSLLAQKDTIKLVMAMHVVQEEAKAHPAYQCAIIQAVLQVDLGMMTEEEMDRMSLRMTRLLILIMMGDHLGSLLEILIPMVIMNDIHGCSSP